MSRSSNKAMLYAAVAAGIGTLGAVGAMSMQRAVGSGHHSNHISRNMMSRRGMMGMMSNISEEFADEFCMMAHKTGNAMIKTGRWINRLVP